MSDEPNFIETSGIGSLGPRDNTIHFYSDVNKEICRIGPDGIMRFAVDASDENAAKFVECIENHLKVRLTGLQVEYK